MPVIPAAALGALVGAMMPQGKRSTKALRGTARKMTRSSARYAATRMRRGSRRMSKRRWQARARREVATPRNYSTAKTTESVAPVFDANNLFNRLKFKPMIDIDKGTGINQRLRDACIVSGFKLTFWCQNLEADRCWINWAVIHPKTDEALSETEADFFRDYDNERSWNAGSAAKTGLSWGVAQINTDKFTILKKGKFQLAPGDIAGPDAAPGAYNIKDCQKTINHWVKLSRTITFKDVQEDEQVPFEQLYFVYWGSLDASPSGNNIGTNGYNSRTRVITYFREPKSG